MNKIFAILIAVVFTMCFVDFCKKTCRTKKKSLPSGKAFPDDRELLILSTDQLMTDYSKADRDELLLYIAKRMEEGVPAEDKVKWEDLHRRVYVSLYGFY